MPIDVHTLEPAIRDPKKLRRTAYLLVFIMILGAVVIPWAYGATMRNKNKDETPAFVSRIVEGRQLDVTLQDGSFAQVPDLSGKVWIICATNSQGPVASARTLEVMKRMRDHYATDDDVRLVTLVLDSGKPEELINLLSGQASALGAQLPKWWVGSQQQETLHKFVKNEFKASLYPHLESGEWEYDTSIFLIDRNRHLRKGVVSQKLRNEAYPVSFDFDQAAGWDAKGVKTGVELTNVEQLEKVLINTVDKLLLEKVEEKSDKGWIFGLIAVLCFLLLGVGMWIRHGRGTVAAASHNLKQR
jgi:cytochrome oxidase Cu insertion factor (SCO1/SenC/PrrC family)